jgi:hypothetical protein
LMILVTGIITLAITGSLFKELKWIRACSPGGSINTAFFWYTSDMKKILLASFLVFCYDSWGVIYVRLSNRGRSPCQRTFVRDPWDFCFPRDPTRTTFYDWTLGRHSRC